MRNGNIRLPPLSRAKNVLDPLLVAKSKSDLFLLPAMANRHGLITGATGTGKTVLGGRR